MAVGVVIDCKGATRDQYDEALAKMGRTPRGRGAPGSLFHWVTATGWDPRHRRVGDARGVRKLRWGTDRPDHSGGWVPRPARDHVLRRAQL